jgi:cation diffusion facilitator family transporter
MFSTKSGAAKISLAVVAALVVLKLVFAIVTGSISILAQAMDSVLDVFAVVATFFAIGFASRPADEEHPYGHGKVEGIAAVGQAVLLFGASAGIIYSSIRRIISGEAIEYAVGGIIVMLVSMLTSIFLSRHLLKVSKATGSLALEANAHNIAADVYTTAGVLAGLVIIQFTELYIIDPIIALIVAVFIIRAAVGVLKKSFGELIDVRLPKEEEEAIKTSIMEHGCQLVDFHDLRTRKAGSQRYVELHLTMPKNVSVEKAHQMCDHLEQDIKTKLKGANVVIHVEPCSTDECQQCMVSCTLRGKSTSRRRA